MIFIITILKRNMKIRLNYYSLTQTLLLMRLKTDDVYQDFWIKIGLITATTEKSLNILMR